MDDFEFSFMRVLMSRIFWLVALLFCVSPAQAGDKERSALSKGEHSSYVVSAMVPAYSQVMSFVVPKEWAAVYENRAMMPIQYSIEFVPAGQTVTNWTDMFTLWAYKGLADKQPLHTFFLAAAASFQQACGKDMYSIYLGEKQVSGHSAVHGIVGCASAKIDTQTGMKKGTAEIGYFTFIQGKHDVYQLHKSRRLAAFDPKQPPLTKENLDGFIKPFLPFHLCETKQECLKKNSHGR